MYDFAIIGGGMVGATAAAMLSSLDKKIAIIEPKPIATAVSIASDVDFRGLALSVVTKNILESYGLWGLISEEITSINKLHVSKKGSIGAFAWDKDEQEEESLGGVVEAGVLTYKLQEYCNAQDNIDAFWGEKPSSYIFDDELWVVKVGDKEIVAPFILAADGINSPIREYLGIGLDVKDFKQRAIVSNVNLNRTNKNTAYKRFCGNKSLAFVPFKTSMMKSILIVDENEHEELMKLDDTRYLELLNTLAPKQMGRISSSGRKVSYPLIQRQANTLIKKNCILLGNSSITVHPVAAQGYNLGVRDIEVLIETLNAGNSDEAFADYNLLRKKAHKSVINATNEIIEIFSSDKKTSKALSSIGMLAAKNSIFLRKKLMNYMLGRMEVRPESSYGGSSVL